MPQVIIVVGTPAKASRLNGITEFVRDRLVDRGVVVDVLQVSDLPPEDLIYARFDSPAVREANERVAKADAVVFASPVYKAAYTGVLKTFLDLLPQKALERKLALPLFIGGSLAHLLAVDYALKPVLSALGAKHQLGGVYAVDQWVTRREEGGYALAAELVERLAAAADEMCEELRWQELRKRETLN
jgi:FMN reductase